MDYLPINHTFAVCAYGACSYLEDCIKSLIAQSVPTRVIICTSTPNEHISGLASRYNIPLYINKEPGNIVTDWNFAYHSADTALVTLAHQDDIYEPDYTRMILENLNRGGATQIAFTKYYEIQDGKRVDSSQFINLKIKELMLSPFRIEAFQSWKWLRRRILSLGNPIGCPSVTYVKANLPEAVFDADFGSNIDWTTWEKLSRRNGRFLYVPYALMGHRMYAESTTVKMINDNSARSKEDFEMLRRFWPEPIAKLIWKMYTRSQKQRIKKV